MLGVPFRFRHDAPETELHAPRPNFAGGSPLYYAVVAVRGSLT
jgi:hypothetical protein